MTARQGGLSTSSTKAERCLTASRVDINQPCSSPIETLHPEAKTGIVQAERINHAVSNDVAEIFSATSKLFVENPDEKLGAPSGKGVGALLELVGLSANLFWMRKVSCSVGH